MHRKLLKVCCTYAQSLPHSAQHSSVSERALVIDAKRLSLLWYCCCCPNTMVFDRVFRATIYILCVSVCLFENVVCENYRRRFLAHSPPSPLLFLFTSPLFSLEFFVWSTVGRSGIKSSQCQSWANKLNCGHFVVKPFLMVSISLGKTTNQHATGLLESDPHEFRAVRLHLFAFHVSNIHTLMVVIYVYILLPPLFGRA